MWQKVTVRDFLRSAGAMGGWAALRFALQGGDPKDQPIQRLEIGGGVVEIEFPHDGFDLPASRISEWVTNAARAVVAYYGVFPVSRMRVHILSSDSQTGVFHGTTWSHTPPFTRISVGRHTTQRELDNDWMMTHELVHTAFPDVSDEHHWIEEGIATYVEPIARVQAGFLSASKIWADMAQGMPQGEPRPGDSGLDHTHSWGRTYWGGALFCLQADVQIRLASHNRVGLQQALRGIQRAGGTIDAGWPLPKALAIGDRVTNGKALAALYGEMKDKAMEIDLDSLWRNLGVRMSPDGRISLDDKAPWAATRLAITSPIGPEARGILQKSSTGA